MRPRIVGNNHPEIQVARELDCRFKPLQRFFACVVWIYFDPTIETVKLQALLPGILQKAPTHFGRNQLLEKRWARNLDRVKPCISHLAANRFDAWVLVKADRVDSSHNFLSSACQRTRLPVWPDHFPRFVRRCYFAANFARDTDDFL